MDQKWKLKFPFDKRIPLDLIHLNPCWDAAPSTIYIYIHIQKSHK